jgi:hypothetical protein
VKNHKVLNPLIIIKIVLLQGFSNQNMKFACVFISAAAAMATLVASMPYTISPNPNPYSEHNKDGSETPLIRLRGPGESGDYDKTAEVTEDEYTVSKIMAHIFTWNLIQHLAPWCQAVCGQ